MRINEKINVALGFGTYPGMVFILIPESEHVPFTGRELQLSPYKHTEARTRTSKPTLYLILDSAVLAKTHLSIELYAKMLH